MSQNIVETYLTHRTDAQQTITTLLARGYEPREALRMARSSLLAAQRAGQIAALALI